MDVPFSRGPTVFLSIMIFYPFVVIERESTRPKPLSGSYSTSGYYSTSGTPLGVLETV